MTDLLETTPIELLGPDEPYLIRVLVASAGENLLHRQPCIARFTSERAVLLHNLDTSVADSSEAEEARLVECKRVLASHSLTAPRLVGVAPDQSPADFKAVIGRLLLDPPVTSGTDMTPLPAGGSGPSTDDQTWAIGPLSRAEGSGPPAARVLFFTDNGHGLGHITRLAAIARQLPEGVAPSFLTLSESSPLLRRLGFPAEHLPSRDRLGITADEWAAMLEPQLDHAFSTLAPAVVVIDHGAPPKAVTQAARRHGAIIVWCRRGLWKRGQNRNAVHLEREVDVVLEPGDLASPIDRGATRARPGIVRVNPITLVDRTDLLPRMQARVALGLPRGGRTVLMQVAADDAETLRRTRDQLADQVERSGTMLFAPTHPLHPDLSAPPESVITREVYPIGRYLSAFDAAISMTGYNSFHELILAQIPTIFLTRETQTVDDQARRARLAELAGAAVHRRDSIGELTADIELLLAPRESARMRAAAEVLYPGNGAANAARIIAEHALGGPP